jgi:P27 family predicted phage terminase small subunit
VAQPTALKIARGNPGQRRLAPDLVQPDRGETVPEPPPWLSERAADEWRRLAGVLWSDGRLTTLDLQPFALYCLAFSRWVAATNELAAPDLNPLKRPVLDRVVMVLSRDVLTFGQHFGLSPASRSRLPPQAEPGPTSKFRDLLAAD